MMNDKSKNRWGFIQGLSRLLSIGVFLSLFAILSLGQEKRELTAVKPKVSDKRTALVIGNGAYTKAKSLPNPSNDAADMAKVLKELGFEVLSGVDLNKRQMENLIRDFGTKLASGGVGLFYYAGHGIQVGGENYLIPVDAEIPQEDEVAYAAVPIGLILTKISIAKNDLNIVILDACRNNPFARSWRGYRDVGNNDGLAKISPPTGTLVLYATEPGKVASDGAGRNGLFTEALLKQIKRANVEYDQMVKALSTDVWQRSNQRQLPWKEGNSLSDFYFVKADAKITLARTEPVRDEPVTVRDAAAIEREAWLYIRKTSTDPQNFRDFLKEFPSGANAGNAKIILEQMVWDATKDSRDKTKIQAYLSEFPTGVNAPLARIRLRQLDTAASPPAIFVADAAAQSRNSPDQPSGMERAFQGYARDAFDSLERATRELPAIRDSKDPNALQRADNYLARVLGRLREMKNWADADKSPTLKKLQADWDSVRQQLDLTAEPLLLEKVAEVECPKDVYSGPDKEKLRADILARWTKSYPDDQVLAIRFPMQTPEREKGRTWREADKTWVETDRSTLVVNVIVTRTPKIARIFPAYVTFDNISGAVIYGTNTKTGGYAVRDMLAAKVTK